VSPILQIAPSSPALRPFIASLWHYTSDASNLSHARERILPTGTMQLLVNLQEDELRTYGGADFSQATSIRGAAISGAYARPFGIDTDEQRCIVGVAFHPGGGAPFFAPPCDALREEHVELERVWSRDGALLRERLLEAPTPAAALRTLEAVLLSRVAHPLEVDKPVDFALGAFERGAPVGHVTDRLGMTPKRFIRRFQEQVGITPKRYARVRRFGRVLEAYEHGRAVNWSAVAASCGYFDQAHLIHEFQEFSGMNPTHYRPRATGDRNHALV
jgi:AraC-like DNA-binding protein